MNRYLYYLAFLMFSSCTCADKNHVEDSETTGYVVTFPDGRKNEIDLNKNQGGKAQAKTPTQVATNQQGSQTADKAALQEKLKSAMGNSEENQYNVDKSKIRPRVKQVQVPPVNTKTALNNVLPISCELINIEWLEKEMKAKEDILTTNSTNKNNPNVSSCFFRWSNDLMPNSGIFLQIMENPVPEEVDNYATYFIKGKLESGENDMEGNKHVFKDFDVVGDSGAYSSEQGRFYWEVSPERVFMLALNLGMSKKAELAHAKAIAKHVMSNYKE